MAGYTATEAVNQVLGVLGYDPISDATYATAVTSTWPTLVFDGSEVGQAARWLYHYSKTVQKEGFPCNTERWQKVQGSTSTIEFPAKTLAVKPIGRNDYRRITMRNNFAYDSDLGTDQFVASTYDFEIVKELDFEELDIDVQTLIIENARKHVEMSKTNNPAKQQAIRTDMAEQAVKARRQGPRPNTTVAAPQPIVMGMSNGGQQQ